MQDKKIRVYSKNRDDLVIKALRYAFEKWCDANLNKQPPGTPWRHRQQQQQQAHEAYGSRVSFGGVSGFGLPPRAASAENGSGGTEVLRLFGDDAGMNGNGTLGLASSQEQLLQVPSRKRSLTQDMQSASQGSHHFQPCNQQQQQQSSSQRSHGNGAAAPGEMGVDGEAAERPSKLSRSSGNGSGGGAAGSGSSNGSGGSRRGGRGSGLPGIAEEAGEGC